MENQDYYFYLMHKNKQVAALKIDPLSGACLKAEIVGPSELVPVGGQASVLDLRKWWNSRSVPVSQGFIEKVLKANGIDSTGVYLAKNLGLSLTDHYWIKPYDSDLAWEDVNLFDNDFKDEIGDLSLKNEIRANESINLIGKTLFYPSASLQGELAKKWICQSGERYLIKGNYGSTYQQSVNEVIASEFHKAQHKFAYTEYRLCEIEVFGGQGIGCICKDFATKNIEFIPAAEIIESKKKRNDESYHQHFIDICVSNGLDRENLNAFFDYMFSVDFILANTDRHLNNYGVLRDSDTLQFMGMAPIFDSGNSMLWNLNLNDSIPDMLALPTSGIKNTLGGYLDLVKDKSIVDLSKLPDEDFIFEMLKKGHASNPELIIKQYKSRVDDFKKQGSKF